MKLMKFFKKSASKDPVDQFQYYTTCTELPLKVFLHICMTGDLTNLRKDPGWDPVTQELKDLWGDLIIEYAHLNNDQEVLTKLEAEKEIAQLQAAYIVIKAMIRYLEILTPDKDKNAAGYVSDLMKMGYHVDCSNSQNYKLSLERADKKSNSIITLIQMKKNSLKGEVEEKNLSFDAIMAVISAELQFIIPDNISVARYCEYKKVMKRRIKIDNIKN